MIKKILNFQERFDDSGPEDEWFGRRLIVWPDAKVSKGTDKNRFAVEHIWHEQPLGFHVANSGDNLADDVWKDPERRKHNFEYCPELVIIMPMKLQRERCPGDNQQGEIVGRAEVVAADNFV
jgi:hypothetical protein